MNITGLGNSLNAKLMETTKDIASLNQYAACGVINAFVNQVQAQTQVQLNDGKKITTMNSNALQSAAASLQYVLACGPGN
jgi:hypothetical protein